MTETQKRFVELDRKKDEIKKFHEEYAAALAALVAEQGVNSYFQDDEGVVYKLTECEGKFVYFDKYAANRTRRPGEAHGTLSLKEAREKGFKVD